ncbi:MAG: AAA family ATPase [Clostridia bacterium]|nr:AAA family ATPase [Clostridia bacterium]
MKINSLSTTGYGKFDQESWENFSTGINVFYGENEAGKSTVFKMMTDLLFGFQSPKIEKNNEVNRRTQQLNVSGEVFYQNENYLVSRAFAPAAQLKIQVNQKQELMANQPLFMVNHISRQTYEEIYALDLNRLTFVKDASWEDIEDLLLQQYSANTFKSPKKIMNRLDEAMKQIKRPTDRGNSLIKTLEQERRDVFKEKKIAQQKLNEAEELNESLEKLQREINDYKSNKVKFQHQLNQLEIYLPVMHLMNEKEQLIGQLDTFLEHEDLNEHYYQQIKNEVRQAYVKMDQISEKVSNLSSERRTLNELIHHEKINEEALNVHHQKQLELDEIKRSLHDQITDLTELRSILEKEFNNTFDERFKEEHIETILNINYLSLKSLIQEIENVYEEIKVLKRNKRTMSQNGSNSLITFFVMVMIASGVMFYLNQSALYNYISIGAFGGAFVGIIHQLFRKRNSNLDEQALFDERDDLRNRIVKELNHIALATIVSEFIGQEFLTQILSIKKLAETYVNANKQYEKKLKSSDLIKGELVEFLMPYQMELELSSFKLLWEKLNEQKKHEGRIEIIEQQLNELNEEIQLLEQNLNEKEKWLLEKDSFLKTIGKGDLNSGFNKMISRHQDMIRLKDVEEKIEKLNFSTEEMKKFTSMYDAHNSFYDKASVQMELELISKALNDKMIEHAKLIKDYERLLDEGNVEDLNAKLISLDEEIQNEKMNYDRYLLMHHIVKTADERFRIKNQPEVFQFAGRYLSQMTNGKYVGLEVVELTDSKKRFEIQVLMDNGMVTVDETFSLGTLNQIYLALRLSLIDHLDHQREALPICFDELLVNWDQNRLENTLEIINLISKKRQVMIFTCHEWLVNALQMISNVKVYNL